MTGKELLKASDDLEQYLATYDELLGRVENREHFRRFSRGQLGTLERKSLEPMALAEGVPPRTLQFFFSRYVWDAEGVRDELQAKVAAAYGGEDGIFIVDETSDAKKGEWTAGIARQYCGESGKVDNCIVTVHLAYARGDFHVLIDGELFLPKRWNPDPQDEAVQLKRRRAEIPDDVVHESKLDMALRQLARAKRNGMPGRWVTADELYGRSPGWRTAVAGLGLRYVVEIPKNVQGWTRQPRRRLPAWSGRGRRPKRKRFIPKAQTVEALAAQAVGLRFCPWQRFRVHDTHKGPEVWEFKTAPFREQGENAPNQPQRLLVGRNVRTGEVKYFLSNASEDTPLSTLIHVAFSRWRIERCFEDCKSELGLNHAEIRNYRGLHRHLILTAVNYFFLQTWMRNRSGGKNGRPHRQPVRRCDPEVA